MGKTIKSGNAKIDQINDLIEEIEKLKTKLNDRRKQFNDCVLQSKAEDASLPPLQPCRMSCAHILKAHNSRIHDIVWSPDDSRLISVGSENCVVFWDVRNGFIDNLVDAVLQQPLTADISPDLTTMFCGGLCANVVIYNSSKKGESKDVYTEYTPAATLEHEGRVACIKHVADKNELLTSAETDGIQIWDLDTMKSKRKVQGHLNAATCLAIINQTNTFLSGGSDGVVKLWDLRRKVPTITTFTGHESDVTCMDVFANKQTFISGSDDTFCQLYDIRYDNPIARYSDPVLTEIDMNKESVDQGVVRPDSASVSTVAITKSGRMFLSGCSDCMMYYWDVFNPSNSVYQREEAGPIRKLVFSNEGHGLASVLWDSKNRLRIFIPS